MSTNQELAIQTTDNVPSYTPVAFTYPYVYPAKLDTPHFAHSRMYATVIRNTPEGPERNAILETCNKLYNTTVGLQVECGSLSAKLRMSNAKNEHMQEINKIKLEQSTAKREAKEQEKIRKLKEEREQLKVKVQVVDDKARTFDAMDIKYRKLFGRGLTLVSREIAGLAHLVHAPKSLVKKEL
jgi:hypothetical protein